MIRALMEQGRQIAGSHMPPKCSITSKKHKIRLTVENVSKMQLEKKVISPDFYLTVDCMCRISFMKSRKWLFLHICNKSATEIKIERTITLYDYNYTKLYKEKEARAFSLPKYKDVDVIQNVDANTIDVLPNDTLVIVLGVRIKDIIKEKASHCIDPKVKLVEDFKTMVEYPIKSDVSLEVGEERIPAHWSVLCSRSPYFKRMFDSGMEESVQNTVTITETSLETVKKLIQFLYTADFDDKAKPQEVVDLYNAADVYEVMDLRTLCGQKLISNATIDDAAETLLLFNRHDDKVLKQEAIDFIRSNSDAVFQTEGWKRFEAIEPAVAEAIVFCLKKNKFV